MKRFVFGSTMLLLCLLGAAETTPALAASKFLLNGAEITSDLTFSVGMEVLMEDMHTFGMPEYLCSWIFDGLIEAGGVSAFINEILMLTGERLGASGATFEATGTVKDLAGKTITVGKVLETLQNDEIECEDMKGVCSGIVTLTALDEPWHLEVTLLESLTYMLHFLSEETKGLAFWLDCNTIGGLTEELCEGPTFTSLENVVGGVLMTWNENSEISCSIGGPGQFLVTAEGRLESSLGTLSVSE